MSARGAVVIVSDTRSAGERADATTPIVRRRLEEAGYELAEARIVPDEQPQIEALLRELDDTVDVILTSGGTGFAARDVTPEATRAVIAREAPGFAELLRAGTAAQAPTAWLSRGIAGLTGSGTLVVNLPGNPNGVEQCLDVLLPLLGHALAHARGIGKAPH